MDGLQLAPDAVTHIDGTHHRAVHAAGHLSGPRGILQGGIATGVLLAAARAHDRLGAPTTAVDARLHAPTPVDRDVTSRVWRTQGAVYEAELRDGDRELVSGTVELAGHDPTPRVADLVSLAEGEIPTPSPDHPAPHCWVCGPDNPEGLHLYPGWRPDGTILQGFAPTADLDGGDGRLDQLVVCAVLDCPTVWAARDAMDAAGFGGALLAGMHVRFFADAPVMEPLRIVARLDQADGRKLWSRSALLDEDGKVYAMASALQIGVTSFPDHAPGV